MTRGNARALGRLRVSSEEPLVWLDPYQAPVALLEHRVVAALARGPVAMAELVERLATAEVYRERWYGVWSLEVGAQALPALRAELRVALEALDGRLIAVETPCSHRVAAFASWQLALCA